MLQRIAGNAAVVRGLVESGRIQRYTNLSDVNHGNVRQSANGEFIVKESDPTRLYRLKGGKQEVAYCAYTGKGETFFGREYREYAPIRKFLADCLHTAEEIMLGQPQHVGKGVRGVRSRLAETGELFGSTDPENVAAADALAKKLPAKANEGASPAPGQAYAIVETGKIGKYPFHAAAVVALDGNDRVTTEVFARNVDAEKPDTAGTFGVYSVSDASQSFHSAWSGVFNKPVTVVIEPK
jgi:hypothetical protein